VQGNFFIFVTYYLNRVEKADIVTKSDLLMESKFKFLFIVFVLIGQVSFSQTKLTRKEYIETFKWIAVREMHRSGIPASITMAQACLESENGNSELSKKSNNHFGIKCKNDWTGGRSYHDDDQKNECFRKYNSVEDSYIDHTDYLVTTKRYKYLFNLSNKDYDAWAKGLREAGYATDPQYAQRLIKIIEDEKLHALDEIKPNEIPKENILASKGKKSSTESTKDKGIETFSNLTINPYSHREVKTLNGLDIVYVNANDTYETIAQEFEMKTWEIYVYNDLEKDAEQPKENDFLYIERKHCRAQKGNDKHILKPQETMYSVSQKYGITLNSLYRFNRMKKGDKPIVGDPIYLRKVKPKEKKK